MCAFKKSFDLNSLKNKMRTTSYHHNLLYDDERLNAFYEAIMEKARGTVYDLGAGCGILSILASFYSNTVYSVEIDSAASKCSEHNFKPYNNIFLINKDVREVIFPKKADLIICEMLDTALIEEEQVPVLNYALKYLKKNGEIIPCQIVNGAEAVELHQDLIAYEDVTSEKKPNYELMSDLVIYDKIDFKKKIESEFKTTVKFQSIKDGIVSGLKITTFTLLTENIICGPTPMLNLPLLIPTEKINVKAGDNIKIGLKYEMGGGLNSIKTKIEPIP